jgi:fibronectin type 3 domain-containing protein
MRTIFSTDHIKPSYYVKLILFSFVLLVGFFVFNTATTTTKAMAADSCTPPATTYGTDTMTLNIPSAGSYTIWTRMQIPSTTDANILMNIDNTDCFNVGGYSVYFPVNTWTWIKYSDADGYVANTATLTAGNHTLTLTGIDPGVSIDRIEALADPTCTPTGTGDNCTPAADTTAPTVNMTSPATATTVSGTPTITATAKDNVAVASVQFLLNGYPLSSQITAPTNSSTGIYSYSWVTAGHANGSYTLSAQAIDTSVNITNSPGVTVTIDNAAACTTNSTTLPSTPASLHSATVTYSTVGLEWTASTPSPGCTLSGYHIFRNGVEVGSSTTGSYTDSGLTAGNSYSYTVEAYDSAANVSAKTGTVSVTTTADNEAPTVPGGVKASATGPGAIALSWTASTDNPNPGGVGVKGYNIYRNNATKPTFTTTGATATSYTDTTVSPSTGYTYTISAIDNAGNESAPSTVVTATTPAPTCSGSPSLPSDLHATTETLNSISLNWTASTPSAGCSLAGYHLYRGGTLVGTITNGTSYLDSGLSSNLKYSYTISAYDTSGHSSAQTAVYSVATLADTTPPSAPSGVTAVAPTSDKVTLTWNASTDNVGVNAYKIYRNGTLLATVSGTTLSYNDTTVAASSDYVYEVSALDAAGNESAKGLAQPNPILTPGSTDNTPPSAPTNLKAPVIGSNGVSLTWTASTDNSGTVSGYHIYVNGVYDADSTTTSFAVACVAPGVDYSFSVKAFDSAGNVSTAASVGATTLTGSVAGDINCDGKVNSTDLFTLLRNWQLVNALPTQGDINGDIKVNSTDLFDMLRNWGDT